MQAVTIADPEVKTEVKNAPPVKLKFAPGDEFQRELKRRIDDYFKQTNLPRQGGPAIYRKTGFIVLWFAVTYGLLVFGGFGIVISLALAVSMSMAAAAIGFNIQHDGGHRAFSKRPMVNKMMAFTIDVVGGSSYFWNFKHNHFHHTYPNITGYDDDIELGIFGRLSPHQPKLFFHRWQNIYLWPLYGFLTLKWQLLDDFKTLATGKINAHPIPRPKGIDLVLFFAGKAIFFGLALGIPLFFHTWWVVVLFYLGISMLEGVLLSVVFQLAHCVEDAEFPMPQDAGDRMANNWYVHQIETTADFARGSRFLTWYLGGLNFQVEHHLFPSTCHTHYPAMSRIVEETCREYGVRYFAHPTFVSSLASHYRWLRRMGREA